MRAKNMTFSRTDRMGQSGRGMPTGSVNGENRHRHDTGTRETLWGGEAVEFCLVPARVGVCELPEAAGDVGVHGLPEDGRGQVRGCVKAAGTIGAGGTGQG